MRTEELRGLYLRAFQARIVALEKMLSKPLRQEANRLGLECLVVECKATVKELQGLPYK